MTFGMKDQNGGKKMNHSKGKMVDNLKMEISKEELTPRAWNFQSVHGNSNHGE